MKTERSRRAIHKTQEQIEKIMADRLLPRNQVRVTRMHMETIKLVFNAIACIKDPKMYHLTRNAVLHDRRRAIKQSKLPEIVEQKLFLFLSTRSRADLFDFETER